MSSVDRVLDVSLGGVPSVAASADEAPSWKRALSNSLALGTGDLLSISVSILLAQTVVYWGLGGSYGVPVWASSLVALWFAGAALLHLLPGWGLGPVEELRRVTTLLVGVFGTLIVTTFYGNALAGLYLSTAAASLQSALPEVAGLAAAGVTCAVTVPLMRTWVRRALIEAGQWGIPAVVFGAEPARDTVAGLLESEPGMGYTPVLRGDLADLAGAPSRTPRQSVAVLALEGLGRADASRMLEGPLSAYRTVIVVPDLMTSPCLWVRPRDLRGVLGLEITRNLSSVTARVTKRTTDVFLVLAAAPVWFPICLVLSALIWLEDRRSPLFLQERVGSAGRAFQTFKFRTMRPDAEAVLAEALATDAALREEWEANYKLRVDPRITRVGRLLRAVSLDELPQLLNVLIGDMSLVGPRPLPSYHHVTLSPGAQMLRQQVRPGITGLWQVSGRSDIGNEGMELWDPYYVRNWSLWLDAVILVRTARAVIARSGAY
ncbi:sugar transferase [Rubrivirga marina]|uniref:sugar transferase n=1 Tax=Rubrivirga marina TaxID=1196024 RepID=UPI000BA8EF3E|nr:sugar transferase [Rubrivirga marina]